MYTIKELYDLEHTLAKDYLGSFKYPWEALGGIGDMITVLGKNLDPAEYEEVSGGVWVHRTAHVFPSAWIGAPCIIGPDTEVRHCAFIRGSALVGAGCVVGNSTELKNVILFDKVEAPHYNYVGDSILGFHAHMGAGSITSNIKSDRRNIVISSGDERFETGLRKIGAMLGDYVESGCNSVMNPGTIVGRNCTIYPTACVRGVVEEGTIWKNDGTLIKKTGSL